MIDLFESTFRGCQSLMGKSHRHSSKLSELEMNYEFKKLEQGYVIIGDRERRERGREGETEREERERER